MVAEVKSNGVYDQVKSALEGYEWEEFDWNSCKPRIRSTDGSSY